MLNATANMAHHAPGEVLRGWPEATKVAFCLRQALYFFSLSLLAPSDNRKTQQLHLRQLPESQAPFSVSPCCFSDFSLRGVTNLKLREIAVPLGVLGLKPANAPPPLIFFSRAFLAVL